MELPFDYICFYIMKILRIRGKNTEITKKSLAEFVNRMFKLMELDEKEIREMRENFDFNYELINLIEENASYFELEGNKLSLDEETTDQELEDVLIDTSLNYDEKIIDEVDETIEYNAIFLDILGIKIRKENYHFLSDLEKKIEKLYCQLEVNQECELSKKEIINKIKASTVLRRLVFLNMSQYLNYNEYYDLFIYSDNVAGAMDEDTYLPLLIYDEKFDEVEIINNSLQRAVFLVEPASYYNIKNKMFQDIKTREDLGLLESKSEQSFYLHLLNNLTRELEIKNDFSLCQELAIARYRLMNALDTVYDITTFLGKTEASDYIKDETVLDYSFIKQEVYFFIRELLEYQDCQYTTLDGRVPDSAIYYYNFIKMLFIETYYKLTKDEKIINLINNNKNYGINKISSNLLSSIVDKPKRKIK